jgi:hypothetical protein
MRETPIVLWLRARSICINNGSVNIEHCTHENLCRAEQEQHQPNAEQLKVKCIGFMADPHVLVP